MYSLSYSNMNAYHKVRNKIEWFLNGPSMTRKRQQNQFLLIIVSIACVSHMCVFKLGCFSICLHEIHPRPKSRSIVSITSRTAPADGFERDAAVTRKSPRCNLRSEHWPRKRTSRAAYKQTYEVASFLFCNSIPRWNKYRKDSHIL